MGLGDVLNNLFKKEEKKKKFESPNVKFMEDDDPTGVTHTIPISVEAPIQQYIIKHHDEYLVFNALDEMPPELRAELQHLDKISDFSHTYSVIVDGERKTYSSLEDMPEDIRNAVRKQ
jgi:hypothetical protein